MKHKYPDLNGPDLEEERILTTYRSAGFITSASEEQALHMSFSPFRVERGLSKLQVRRRINHYLKHGITKPYSKKEKFNLFGTNRLEMKINGKPIFGATFTGKTPKNLRQLRKLLTEILDLN